MVLHEFLIANREELIAHCREKVAKRDSPRPTSSITVPSDVTISGGADDTGRILAQTQVALQQATVTQPAP